MSLELDSKGNLNQVDSEKKKDSKRPFPIEVVNKWRELDAGESIEHLLKLNDIVRKEIEHEDTLISNRLTALVISQSFLVNAFVQYPNLKWVVVLGMALCALNFLSIDAARRTANYYREILVQLKRQREMFNLVGERVYQKRLGYFFGMATPIFIIGFWLVSLLWPWHK